MDSGFFALCKSLTDVLIILWEWLNNVGNVQFDLLMSAYVYSFNTIRVDINQKKCLNDRTENVNSDAVLLPHKTHTITQALWHIKKADSRATSVFLLGYAVLAIFKNVTQSLWLYIMQGACSQVDRALDLRSEDLGCDSQCWPYVEVLGKLRSKVG